MSVRTLLLHAAAVPVTGASDLAFTGMTLPVVADWRTVAYGNSAFVALNATTTGSQAATSPDGVTWTAQTMPSATSWFALAYGVGLFAAAGPGGGAGSAASSPDGAAWTTRTMVNNQVQRMTFGGTRFVLVTSGTGTVWSTNGTSWTNVAGAMLSSGTWAGLNYGNSIYVAVMSAGSALVARSSDGATWSGGSMPGSSVAWSQVAYGAGLWVAAATGPTTTYATSPDATSWTLRTMPSSQNWSDVIFANGRFVAIANGAAVYATSLDGLSWQQYSLPSSGGWRRLGYGNGKFVIIPGASGTSSAGLVSTA